MDLRLGRIEDQLKDQSRQPTPESIVIDSNPTRLYEGASSFANQSAYATEVAQLTASTQGTVAQDRLTASFDDLKSLLQPSTTLEDFQFSRSNAFRSMPAMKLVPSAIVADIVRSFKVRVPYFLLSRPVNDLNLIEELFRKVYFPTEALSVGHVTAMHGVLFYLLKEFISFKDPLAEKYDLSPHLETCEKNFSAGIETYEILVVPNFENTLSLLLAVIKAQDEANVLLSSTLISVASRHCLVLGYHRSLTYQNQKADMASNICRLFWTVYLLDKNMSLLLGRASCIQDYDIDVPYPTCTGDLVTRAWDEGWIAFLSLGRLQGQIYDRVYSAAALKLAPEVRAHSINELAQELHQWHQRLYQVDFSHVQLKDPALLQMSQRTWDVTYYSVLTSLLRGSSTSPTTPEITSQCFKAARSALETHLGFFPMCLESEYVSVRDYANWLMLYASFTPFIVIFLHAIAASSAEDTKLLEDVVRTLYPTKDTSKACGRLYQICAIFARVARRLVESRHSFLGTYNAQDDSLLLLNDTGNTSLFDPGSLQDYLSAEIDMMDQFTYSEAENMSAILGNWVSGQPPTVDMLGMGTE
ncbi:hypothetical protein ASPSYDRAFT_39849 [Aspergillus sydowii CBS 593.65]|uniref:Xylanolytic transcriptional activator regulatory domain-containing protein n=1 Tax=Aspergillus sydowii CBS 593.65 TaxID=1036612 RepID=A0A1L9U070_9EURO|nr:uncharacterized protein ASPSYDRAFT_39849 [Aspergillus sydowii CBS 593.65]OJJ65052.1 hypothetical protein ASPSYDRAFT_39849 [Aspergillus sydowii CBS 593.65]